MRALLASVVALLAVALPHCDRPEPEFNTTLDSVMISTYADSYTYYATDSLVSELGFHNYGTRPVRYTFSPGCRIEFRILDRSGILQTRLVDTAVLSGESLEIEPDSTSWYRVSMDLAACGSSLEPGRYWLAGPFTREFDSTYWSDFYILTESLSALSLRFEPDSLAYRIAGPLTGTIWLTNNDTQNICVEIRRQPVYHLEVFDSLGTLRLTNDHYPQFDWFYLEIAPACTDTVAVSEPLSRSGYHLSPGSYRVRASLSSHPEVYDEVVVELR